jgi:phosphatidylglycerol:prolipoprotein diacylglycerol transferase
VLFAEIVFPGWNPVALHLGPLAIRWYGLGYLAGFVIASLLLDRMVKDGFLPLTKAAVSDLIGWLVAGVLVGGRLGYALFYDPRMLTHPVELVKLWEGGLSFHGGLAGVLVASVWFARRRRVALGEGHDRAGGAKTAPVIGRSASGAVSWGRLADGLALAAPPGIFLVRCANFVNGELFGRVAPAWLPWGMRFPTDPAAQALSPELARAGPLHWHDAYAALRAGGAWDAIARQVPLRHPSQLYEAALEGLLVFAVLWWLYARARTRLAPGKFAAAFLLLYAVARFLIEFTRQPDAQFVTPAHPLGTVLGPLSMGQLLSLLLAAFGVVLLLRRAPATPGPAERERPL